MFVSLKDKFQTVQDGLAASFRNLTIHGGLSSQANVSSVNANSGADILHHYQRQWARLHRLAEANATKAEEVDTYIGGIHTKVENEWDKMSTLCSNLAKVPQMTKDVEKLIIDIGTLHKIVENVESMLIQLEDTIETEKLQEKQLEKRFKLAMHREKKLHELDNVRSQLSSDHLIKLNDYESQLKCVQKERQATFGVAFQNDIEQYKKFGAIPLKVPTGDQDVSLDEVELDYDSDELNEFVNS